MGEEVTKADKKKNIYPNFYIAPNKNPNRLYAFPFFGVLIKIILLIPVFIEAIFLAIAVPIVLLITWIVVEFTGKYWSHGYYFFVGALRFWTKISVFMYGMSDKYPGFNFSTNGMFTLEIEKPVKPNRWLAIPLIGFLVRLILLIPYHIFSQVLQNGSTIAWVITWFTVLFKKKFPESLYEFEFDTHRVSLAASVYLFGLSDKYPSFAISMNHQTIKILLIVGGALLTAANWGDSMMGRDQHYNGRDRYDYNQNQDLYAPPAMDDSRAY